MKKHLFKFNFSLMLLSLFSFFSKENNFHLAKASEEYQYQEIGYIFDVSRVKKKTKVYVNEEQKQLAIEASGTF